MGSIKLHMEPIAKTVVNECSKIKNNALQNIMTLITLVCNSATSRYEGDNRPRVKVTQNNIEHSFLYDTGAQRSCMPFKAFKRIYGTTKLKKKPEPDLKIKDAGGNDLGYKGTYLVPMQILGRKIMHDLVILEHVQDQILGIDFIKQHTMSYNSLQEKCFWETPPIDSGILRAQERLFIDALSSRKIKLKCVNEENSKIGQSNTMIATISTPHSLITGPPGLIQFDKEGTAYAVVQNCSPYAIWIERDDPMGYAELHTEGQKSEKLDKKFLAHLLKDVTINSVQQEKTKLWTEEAKRDHIIEHANVNVPAQYRTKYQNLLIKHFGIVSINKSDLGRVKDFFHKIHLKDNEPVYRKQFKIPDAHRPFLEESLAEWLKLGVVQKSDSLYNSPVFCVPKKGGNGYRIVQDFRELNQKSLMDKYTMKDIHECIGDIGRSESTIFSTLDLTSGFWQMPLHSDSVPKTAFTLPGLGQYEWLTSPMGLLGCPASFQRLMEKLMDGIDNVIVYIDDLLIHSKTHEHHLQILDVVMTRLADNNMKINVAKCFFGNTEVNYLGFRLTPEGIKPGKDKLKAVENAKIPATKEEIKSFVGLCNFFRTHIKDFARLCEPLNKATRKDSEYVKGPITGKALEAFRSLQEMLCAEPVMAYPRYDRTYALIVDASTGTDQKEGGMGAILCQIDKNGKFHALSYASKQLIKHEKNYSPFLLEMDAVVWAMEYYQEYLRGRRFIMYTDHKPLETMGTLHTKTMNRLQLAMMDFDFEIRYKKGSEMPADFLSRSFSEINAISALDIDWVHEQQKDNLSVLIRESLNNEWTYKFPMPEWYRKAENLGKMAIVRNNVIWIKKDGKKMIYVPYARRKELLFAAHGDLLTGHDGVQKCRERIQECYFWLNMDEDILAHTKECLKCQVTKANRFPTTTPLQPMPQCSLPNQRIHMDLFGPCKTSDMGNKYIQTITDAFTKYSEIVAIPNKEAETVADAVFTKWICRYGCPAVIHTDGGKEFLNKIATELYQKLDIKSTHTAPAHPQCNSQAEVFNKSLAKFLKNVVDETTLNWEWYLAPLMFCYNTSYHSTTKSTPFELTYGMKPRLPTFPIPELQRISYGEGFVAERLQILRKARQIALDHSFEAATAYKDYHDQKASKHNLVEGDYAYIDNQLFLGKNKKLSQRWIGPYLVTKVINDQNVELQMSPKRVQVHSAYRLKKFIDPKASKFLDKERNKKEMTTGQETEFNPKNLSPENRKHLNEEIKSKIEKRITRSMTNQSKNEQAIAVINNLIIPDSEKLKLKTIAKKIYQSSRLTEEEASFWNSFPNSEKSYILTGDSASTLDFTEYQKATFCSEQQNNQGQNQEVDEQQNLFFEPSSSDTDSSDDSDYIQPIPLRRIISNTDDSWPDNSGSNLFNQPSTSTQQPKQQDNLDLDRNSSTESSEIDLSPKVTTKNKPTKSIVDSWKNTAQSLWKPSSRIKVDPDPVAISTRTRSKAGENEPEQLVSHPHDLNIDAMCSDKSEQRRAKSPSGFQKNWPLRNQCALPSHQDSCKPFTNH
jgi:hypothetical protein